MRNNMLGCLAIVLLGTTLLSAQASRTWVSGVGDDANPCSRTAPCKTWAGAISKTALGGEIDALDPGGFGALTITKAITLDGGGGQVASTLVAGTNGIVVVAGAGDVVIIRNIRFDGLGPGANAGINGIQFSSGKSLDVENCVIFGFNNNGINIALNQGTQASVHIINTVVKNVGQVGIRAANAIAPPVQVQVENSKVMLATTGIEAAQHSRVTVVHSAAAHASGDGLLADDAATTDAQMTIEFSDSSFNNNGITSGTGSNVSVGFSKIAFNASCSMNQSAGNFFTFVTTAGQFTNQTTGNPCGTILPFPSQ